MIEKDKVKNILITRTDRLGDVILTLPLINAVKSVFDDSNLFFLTKKYVAGLVSNYDGISELIVEESIPGFFEKYSFFKKKKIDLAISVKPRFDLALIFFILRIKYRIGTAYRWYSFMYNMKVHEHRKVSDKHESQYNLNLIKAFFPDAAFNGRILLKYSNNERENLDKKLSDFGLNQNDSFIIIHPGSGNSAKDVQTEVLSEFIEKFLIENSNYKVVLTGSDNESELVCKIINRLDKTESRKVLDLSGKFDLRELMILIDKSKLFISNSTGPIHIAGALNKNIIGFYPNEKQMSDVRWGPLSDSVIILKPGPDDNMNDIMSEDILAAAGKLLKNNKE